MGLKRKENSWILVNMRLDMNFGSEYEETTTPLNVFGTVKIDTNGSYLVSSATDTVKLPILCHR